MADYDRINRVNRDYWEKRALKLEHLTQQKASDTVKAICQNYDEAQENIVAQIEKIFSRYVNNNETLNEEKALQLLSEKQTAEYRQQLLEQYHSTDDPQLREEIRARLDAPAYANRISRLQALRDRLYVDCRKLGLSEVSLVRDRLKDVLDQSYLRQTFDIQQGVGRYYDFSKLSNRQMQAIIAQPWSGANYSSRIWNNNREFARNVERTVSTGILSGQSYREMAENLRHVVGEDDSQGAKYKSMRLVRTECNHVATQGQLLGYQAGGIEEYIFLATLDLVTSKICRSLDMKKFPVSEAQTGVNLPPMHPHCRSTTMPDMDADVLAKIQRAARDPVTGKSNTVPGDMSYSEWYDKYVKGNAEAEANEKKIQNKASDKKQFEKYRAIFGDDAPKSLVSFQRMKYNYPEKWSELKSSKQSRLSGLDFEDMGKLVGTLGNKEVRQWYKAHDEKIPTLIDKSLPLEDQARQAHSLRNQYRTQARDLMKDQKERQHLDLDKPNLSFAEMLERKRKKYGLNGEDAYLDVVRSSTTTNKEYDKKAGLNE